MLRGVGRLPLLLAGANWRERMIAAAGALLGIGVSALVAALLASDSGVAALLVAPMGASAVLLFAVPSSPLAQPWPTIGGNVTSTIVGIAVALWFGHGPLACGLAVSLAIVTMSALRCLHPPGGACALMAVIGGPAVLAHGYAFALVPVGLNVVILTAVAVAFHRISGHSYPHRPASAAPGSRILPEDIDAALAEAGESFDIAREDLESLLESAERHAARRRR